MVILVIAFLACALAEPVILVSFDGFRHDYYDYPNASLPSFKRLAREGARVQQLVNIFPTKTFPNHWTLATGRYAESHGIVDNRMYDPELDEYFNMSSCGTWWDLAEPVWVTANRGNQRSAAFWWPGSDCAWQGSHRATYTPREGIFNKSVPFEQRVDEALEWLALPPSQQPQFVALYFEEPDTAGHHYGPYDTKLLEALELADKTLQRLLDGLDRLELTDRVNLIVTSDHGMAEVASDRIVYLSDANVTTDLADFVSLNPVASINPKNASDLDMLYQRLTQLDHATVYRRDPPSDDLSSDRVILDRWHYRTHRRVQPLIVVAEEGWSIAPDRTVNVSGYCCGAHGYDNALSSMHPILLARGPSIRNDGFVVDQLLSVDVYPLMCRLLGVSPAVGHNGTKMQEFTVLLRITEHPKGKADLAVALGVGVVAAVVAGLLVYRRFGQIRERFRGGKYTYSTFASSTPEDDDRL
eukprot:TRINITY_DN13136_c0_g1_i1.p2 TRINITY_DN13136_c0_g1~~TRINITY_DN13136_c0_g1_i1.p2  ORF type:complete len:470 (-),score=84.72 TRINITY_DN13136_c0_g1_i1:14-1423(-)